MSKKLADYPGAFAAVAIFSFLTLIILPLLTTGFEKAAAYFGALVGLFALLIAAMVNAQLNRQRDKDLETQEVRVALGAILFEVSMSIESLSGISTAISNGSDTTNRRIVSIVWGNLSTAIFERHIDRCMSILTLEGEEEALLSFINYYRRLSAVRKLANQILDDNEPVVGDKVTALIGMIDTIVSDGTIVFKHIKRILKELSDR